MKVLLLSRYGRLGASSRVRFLQYLPYFRSQGVDVEVKSLFSDAYLRAFYSGRSRWRAALRGYLRRVVILFNVRRFDVVVIEKELFPFIPAIAERFLHFLGVRYVVDYDDALFHRYDCHRSPLVRRLLGHKIDVVMRYSAAVTAGNNYLADRASRAGARNVEIIPTVVDISRYTTKTTVNEVPVVGWIGTPETSHRLQPLIPTFQSIQNDVPVKFVAVGARQDDFVGSPIEAWPWSEETEVALVQKFDIGIMPLTDSLWERGKCGYKLIQYMACGVPVVASAVGVNPDIVAQAESGYLVDSADQWEAAIRKLLSADSTLREELGKVGRVKVEEWYSLQVQAPRLLSVIREAAGFPSA